MGWVDQRLTQVLFSLVLTLALHKSLDYVYNSARTNMTACLLTSLRSSFFLSVDLKATPRPPLRRRSTARVTVVATTTGTIVVMTTPERDRNRRNRPPATDEWSRSSSSSSSSSWPSGERLCQFPRTKSFLDFVWTHALVDMSCI